MSVSVFLESAPAAVSQAGCVGYAMEVIHKGRCQSVWGRDEDLMPALLQDALHDHWQHWSWLDSCSHLRLQYHHHHRTYCLSNAMHSIGQTIKSLACLVCDVRCPMSGLSLKNFKMAITQQRVIPLTLWLVLSWVFFSKDGVPLFNLTAHELHELYYDRPTS